ncbi:MAG: four helix bundle protein [Crocinitomicaceae bacterium]
MGTIAKFEDLTSWKKARELCEAVFKLTLNETFAKDFSLKDQINRSSGSSMDNIAEGFDRNSNKEFRQFLFIARSSTSEVKSQLYRALDREYITQDEFNNSYKLATDTANLIGGFLNYLRDKNEKKIN